MTARSMLVWTAIGALVATAPANDLPFMHIGQTDPVAENWGAHIGGDCAAGALTNDLGFDAWYTLDASTYDSVNYSQSLTQAQVDGLSTTGWRLAARVRVPAENTNTSVGLWYSTGVNRFVLNFLCDSAGQQTVNLVTDPWNWGAGPRFAINNYQLVDLVCVAGSASLYIDGQLMHAGYIGDGYSGEPSHCAFGSGSSGATGQGNWNCVEFAPLPEPAGLLLLATSLTIVRRRA